MYFPPFIVCLCFIWPSRRYTQTVTKTALSQTFQNVNSCLHNTDTSFIIAHLALFLCQCVLKGLDCTFKSETLKIKIICWKLLPFNFLTATFVSPEDPFNPLTTAFHTSPKEPLPKICCNSTCFGATSQAETERQLVVSKAHSSSLKNTKFLLKNQATYIVKLIYWS